MYPRTQWKDEVKDQQTGEIIQEGTDQSARNFNNAESGISDAHTAAAVFMMGALQKQRLYDDNLVSETKTLTLNNTLAFPFNSTVSSPVSVSLSTPRTTLNYDVSVEVQSANGNVGDIQIIDKLLNGFKIKYSGSAKSVTVLLRIKGGMNA